MTASVLAASGPVFVKVGQHLSARADLFSEASIEAFAKLRDSLPLVPTNGVRQRLADALDAPIEDIFESFDWSAIGSGSVALVFWATTRRDNRSVAVKVLRPGIEAAIDVDTRLLLALARLLDRAKIRKSIPFEAAILEVAASLRRQLDLRFEGERQAWYVAHSYRGIRVPRVLNAYTRKDVLVTEYIEGLRAFDAPDVADRLFQRGAETLLGGLYCMLFVHGVIHGDLHAGNVLFDRDGNVVLLDFGVVATFTDPRRIAFRALFQAMADDDGERASDIVRGFAMFVPSDFRPDEFRGEMRDLISSVNGKTVGDFRVAGFVSRLFELQQRHGLIGAPDFVWAILSLLAFEGLVMDRYPELDFQNQARPHFVAGLIEATRRSLTLTLTQSESALGSEF